MRAINPAPALLDCARQNARFAQQLQGHAPADDVNDGIHRTDLVKMHSLRRQAMNLSFSHGNPVKYRNRFLLYPIRQAAVLDEFANLSVGAAVFMLVVVLMLMSVRMAVSMSR